MKKLKDKLEFLGLDFRKEMIFFVLFSVLFAGVTVAFLFWRGLGFLTMFPLLGYAGFAFFFFTRYGAMVNRKLEQYNREFVNLFTFFGVFVSDGFTVYRSLEMVKEYASDALAPHFAKLLQDIDEDKSVEPYVRFASVFRDVSVKEVMLAVYQMVDEGEGGVYIRQFQRLFGKLSDTRHSIDEARRLDRLDTLSFLPLCGAGIAMLSLTMSVMEVMGELMDVL